MIPKSGDRFSEKIMLKSKPSMTFEKACPARYLGGAGAAAGAAAGSVGGAAINWSIT